METEIIQDTQEQEEKQPNKLETGNIWSLMISLSIPCIVAQLVGILYNMVDRMFIGRIENASVAMAALSVSLPLITCITAFTRLVGIGGAPRCAIKMGQGNQDGAEEIMGVSFASLVATGVILTVVILIFQVPILRLFGADDTTLPVACDYVGIYSLGTVFVMIALGMNSYITTQGFARTGMFTVLIGAFLNIIFDAVLINGFHMGVKGAAIATIVAQGISCVWALSFLFGKKSLLKMRKKYFKIRWRVLLPIMSLGVSPFTMSLPESLIQGSFNNQLAVYGGTIAVGTVTILFSLWQFVTLPIQGLCQGAQPIISYNYGASNFSRVRQACKISIVMCLIFAASAAFLMIGFPALFASVFSNDPSMIRLCSWAMPVYLAGGVVFGAQVSCQQSFMSLGQARTSLLLACLRKVVMLAPFIYIFPVTVAKLPFAAEAAKAVEDLVYAPAEVFSIFLAEPVSDVAAAICTSLTFAYFYRKHLGLPDKASESTSEI